MVILRVVSEAFSKHLLPFWAFVLSSELSEMQIKAMIHIQTIRDLCFGGLCYTPHGVSFLKLILVENYQVENCQMEL